MWARQLSPVACASPPAERLCEDWSAVLGVPWCWVAVSQLLRVALRATFAFLPALVPPGSWDIQEEQLQQQR